MTKSIYVAGHLGMVGSAICRQLKSNSDSIELLTARKDELDLRDAKSVEKYIQQNAIDEIYIAAAKVGGIQANSQYPVEFLFDNICIQNNIISAAHSNDIDKLLFLGSSCIYPKFAPQPISEEALLTGELEPTNEPYAIGKIAGLKLCESYNREYQRDYRSVMPTNLYGPGDNFNQQTSHVIPALLARFHGAKIEGHKEVTLWGSGKPLREFMHVEDLAAACIHIMNLEKKTLNKVVSERVSHVNIGTGIEHSIRKISELVSDAVGFKGKIVFDTTKPDGTPRKLLNVSKLKLLGWESQIKLEDGLRETYRWFLENQDNLRI